MFRERNKKGLEIQQFWQLLEMKTSKWKTMYLCWLPGTCINPFSTKFLLNFQDLLCARSVFPNSELSIAHPFPPAVQAKTKKKKTVRLCWQSVMNRISPLPSVAALGIIAASVQLSSRHYTAQHGWWHYRSYPGYWRPIVGRVAIAEP